MAEDQSKPAGPDLTQGVTLDALPDGGMLVGHVGEAEVLLVRLGAEIFAIDALCSHYHGPLADGLVVEGAVRCPWHHACFDLRTGEAVRAPAFSPLACWSVEQRDGLVFVREQRRIEPKKAPTAAPERIVIIGGGAAGFAAAERLRRETFSGSIVMLSDDDAPPVDRPNLSKDYLAGSAPEDWVPLKPDSFYAENAIDLRLNAHVTGIDRQRNEVTLGDGGKIPFDRLLLATGAEPIRLPIPGADLPHVHVLRSLVGLPGHHRRGQRRETGGGGRRELYRSGKRGGAARPQYRGSCGGARDAAAGADSRPADGRFHSRAA